MSDSISGPDPGGPDRRLPETSLYSQFEEVYRTAQIQVVDYLLQTAPERFADMSQELIAERTQKVDPEFSEAPVPAIIAGSEFISVKMVSAPEPTREGLNNDPIPYYGIDMQLLRGFEPYIPEDIEAGTQESRRQDSRMTVFLGESERPFIIANSILDDIPPTGMAVGSSPVTYLKMLKERGEEPRYLDETEIAELKRALGELPLDLEASANEVGGSGLFHPPDEDEF